MPRAIHKGTVFPATTLSYNKTMMLRKLEATLATELCRVDVRFKSRVQLVIQDLKILKNNSKRLPKLAIASASHSRVTRSKNGRRHT